MRTLLLNEAPAATGTQPAWNWDASVSLPQQVYAPPADFLERIKNTVAVREQAVQFFVAAEVSPEVKQEMAEFLTWTNHQPRFWIALVRNCLRSGILFW